MRQESYVVPFRSGRRLKLSARYRAASAMSSRRRALRASWATGLCSRSRARCRLAAGMRLASNNGSAYSAPRSITSSPRKEQTVSTQASVPTAREVVRGVAPKLIDLSEKVLFGDVWERPGLSKRDRSFITVAALIAMYRTDQLPGHLERALNNGVTKEEIGEIITHLAFYAGWPAAMTAGTIARKIFDARKP